MTVRVWEEVTGTEPEETGVPGPEHGPGPGPAPEFEAREGPDRNQDQDQDRQGDDGQDKDTEMGEAAELNPEAKDPT